MWNLSTAQTLLQLKKDEVGLCTITWKTLQAVLSFQKSQKRHDAFYVKTEQHNFRHFLWRYIDI